MNRKTNDTTEKTVKLSARLAAVAALVEPGSRVADVGTDHGYIPIYLVQTGIADRAIAMDVRSGPLERARAHVDRLPPGCRERIETRLSDGLKALSPGEADTVVIAGMGGELMIRILDEGRHSPGGGHSRSFKRGGETGHRGSGDGAPPSGGGIAMDQGGMR